MSIHQLIKDTINQHKNKIELFQMATIAGMASLVYSEYIRCMKQKYVPTHRILVTPIKSVQDFLKSDGQFMNWMSDNLIDSIVKNELFLEYQKAPEFELFMPKDVEVLKTILDLYIIPNAYRRIPETIAKKFQLNGDNRNQLFIESPEVDLFNLHPVTDDLFNYVTEEIILQMLMIIPTMDKSVDLPETNIDIQMNKDEIVTIENNNGICPIHLNSSILDNKRIMNILSFVTNTSVDKIAGGSDNIGLNSRGRYIDYIVTTSNFNRVSITTLKKVNYVE